ncbi:hypothetical protein TB9_23370, partial [Xanthomonas perforans]
CQFVISRLRNAVEHTKRANKTPTSQDGVGIECDVWRQFRSLKGVLEDLCKTLRVGIYNVTLLLIIEGATHGPNGPHVAHEAVTG